MMSYVDPAQFIPRGEWDNALDGQERCFAINPSVNWQRTLDPVWYEREPWSRCARPLGHTGPHIDGKDRTWD